ncbi:autotransporter-associated beta strand repeat-containing protein [Aquabacter cavernae]|uniref:autotransporter-associated beta strand repeat-containing protein n=1 Tax=Aquabacter cavernae TaxID=2496029 RepID=UPI00237C59C5|nr:autotransporter-associated beta strand repeat-containing protein [Aquabacter cavernae]
MDGSGADVSGKTAGAGANAPNSLTFSNTRTYDFVGIGGGGGGGGSGDDNSTPGSAGSNGSLTLDGAQVTVNYSILVGGAGGGGGYENGGDGGSGTLVLTNSASLSVAETLLIGGSGGGGGNGSTVGNGGNGGAGAITVGSSSAITIGAGGQLILGGASGGNSVEQGGRQGIGGTGASGTLTSAGAITFGAGAGFTINSGSTFNLGTAVPGASTTGAITGLSSVANNGIINFNQSNSTYTFAASITGAGSLNQNGSGTTTLTGTAGTFTGTVNVTAGTLALGAGGVMSSGDTSVGVAAGSTGAMSVSGADASWTIASGGQFVVGDGGAGSLTVGAGGLLTSQTVFLGYATTGAGTLTLTGNDTDGRGMVATTQVRKRQGSGQIVFNGGGLRATAAQSDFLFGFASSDIDIQAGGAFIDSNGNAITITQDLSGTGGFTKQGTGTLTLAGSNSFAGATSVSGGTLTITSGSALSDTARLTLDSGTTLNVNTAAETVGSLAGSGTVHLNASLTVGGDNTDSTFSGTIDGAGALTKTGTGRLTLGSANSFAGNMTVSGGTVNATDEAALGLGDIIVSSGATLEAPGLSIGQSLTLNGSGVSDGGALRHTSGDSTFAGFITLGSATRIASDSGTLNLEGTISGAGMGLTVSGAGNTVISGVIGTAGGTLTKLGTGTLTLTAANTYTGATTITAGTLALSGSGSIATSASVLVDGTFDISGISGAGTSVTNLSGDTTTGIVALGTKTLTVTQQTEFLQLAGGLTGSGTLIKQGAEVLTLSGDSSTYSGTVQVNAGTLSITDWGATTAGHVGGNVSVASGGTLEAAGATIDGAVTIASGGILEWTRNGPTIGNVEMGSLTLDAGSVTRINLKAPASGTSIFQVSGNAAVNGTLNLVSAPDNGAGVYRVITTGGTLTNNGLVLGETQPDYTFRIDTQAQSLDVVVTTLDTTVQYWSADGTTRGGGGNWTSFNNWLGADGGYAVWAGGTAVFDGPIGSVSVDGTQSFNTIEFLSSGYVLQAGVSGQLNLGTGGRLWAEGEDIIVTVSAPIIGTGALTKIGEGTVVLSGNNTYLGGTILQAGTLEIYSDANLGDAAGTITFAGGELEARTTLTSARNIVLNTQGVISVDEDSTFTLTGIISGTGSLAFGGGTLVLTGTNTYQGATIIGGGTLSLTGTGSIATSSGVQADGTLDISGTTAGASITSLSGTGSVALGAQTLTLTNASGAFSGTIGGTGGLTLSGGTQALSGVNGFTGATNIAGGTLALTGTGSLAASSGLQVGGTFDISGVSGGGTSIRTLSGAGTVVLGANVLTLTNAAGNFQGGISGTGGLTLGSGTQMLSGTNSYSGTTTIAAGATLIATSSGAMSGGPVNLEGTLQITATTATIGGLTGTGTVTMPSGTASLVIAPASGSTSVFAGSLTSTAGVTILPGTPVIRIIGTSDSVQDDEVANDTLILTGENSYTDPIAAATLLVNFWGNLTAAAGASLGLVLNGPGTQVLTADHTYTGGTTILQGTLQLGNGGTSGSIQGDVANSGTLAFNRSGTATFAGDVSGTGGLTQMGPGTLILTGDNSYTGGTTIAAGTLQVGNGGTQGSIQGDVVNNGVLVFNRSGSVTFSGAVSGGGSLTQVGPGTLILTGDSTYTGGTTITGGTLQIGAGGATGAILGNVVNNGALVFNRSGSLTLAGAISGTGSLTQTGPGTLILTGASSYSGGTSVTGGTLVLGSSTAAGTGAIALLDGTTLALLDTVSVANALDLGGTVTFDLASGTATLSGALSGTGTMAFTGSGRISLTGDGSAFAGETVVDGTLAVNDRLGGTVTVETGGTLKGNGTVGSTSIAAGGTIAPGNSIGALTVDGTLTFASGATYAVEIETTGASDFILVTGTATLGGASVEVTKAAGTYLPGTRYTILTAQGGIVGAFTGPGQDLPFIDLQLAYDPNDVYLDVARNATPFPSVAVTANQRSTAFAVEALGQGNAVYNGVVSQTTVVGAQQAFNMLSGELYPSALSVLQDESLFLRRAVLDRARVPARTTASAPLAYAAGSSGGADVISAPDSPNAFWAQAFGAWNRIDGNGNAATISGDTAGVFVGYDRTFAAGAADWRLGFAAGYSSSNYQVDARSSSFSSDNAHVSLYGGASLGALGLRLGGAYSWADISASRTVVFPGFVNALNADTSAHTGQVFGEVGYGLSFAQIQLEPFAGLAYVNVDMSGFTELGGPAALTTSGSNAGVTYSTLGARVSVPFSLGALPATFNGTLAWQHAFGDTTPDMAFAFGAGALPFAISGVPIASDAALVEAGLDLKVSANAALAVFYAGQLSETDTSNMVKGSFSLKF